MSNKELSIKQVMAECGVTRQTIHNWLGDGLRSRLVFVHGRQQERRIKASELKRFLKGAK